MGDRRLTICIVVCLLLAANAWLLVKRRTAIPAQNDAEFRLQKQRQVEQVTKWEKSPPTSLFGDSLVVAIQQIVSRNCDLKSDPRTAEITSEQQAFLSQTLTPLFRAYVDGDVQQFLKFLHDRNEVIVPHYDEALRKVLTDEVGLDRSQVAKFTWEETVSQYWKSAKLAAGWKNVRIDESCIWIWRADTMQMAAGTPSLFVESSQLFQNQTSTPHIFYSESANVDFIARDGHVLVADILVVIGHEARQKAGTSPYMLRFWFDPVNACWRQLLMVHVDTMGVDSPRIMF